MTKKYPPDDDDGHGLLFDDYFDDDDDDDYFDDDDEDEDDGSDDEDIIAASKIHDGMIQHKSTTTTSTMGGSSSSSSSSPSNNQDDKDRPKLQDSTTTTTAATTTAMATMGDSSSNNQDNNHDPSKKRKLQDSSINYHPELQRYPTTITAAATATATTTEAAAPPPPLPPPPPPQSPLPSPSASPQFEYDDKYWTSIFLSSIQDAGVLKSVLPGSVPSNKRKRSAPVSPISSTNVECLYQKCKQQDEYSAHVIECEIERVLEDLLEDDEFGFQKKDCAYDIPVSSAPNQDKDHHPKLQDSTTATTAATTTAMTMAMAIDNNELSKVKEEDDEYQHWLSKIKGFNEWAVPGVLEQAPEYIRNCKNIVMTAIQKNSMALEFASPGLQNDKQFVMAALKIDGGVLDFASPGLQNDRQVVMTAIQNYYGDQISLPLQFASPELRNDRQVVIAAVQKDGKALEFATPDLQNDKQIVMTAVQNFGLALEFASPGLQNDKQVALAAVKQDGYALQFASEDMQNDRQVVMVTVQNRGDALKLASPQIRQNNKEVVLAAVNQKPDAIKFAGDDLQLDQDVLIASGMYDKDHDDAPVRKQQQSTNTNSTKIALSTRFALKPTSESKATDFTVLFKKSKFFQEGNFILYAPNANYKSSCDPTFTDFNHPCRGTYETCKFESKLKTGHPTDDCCWRYSFRSQLQEAKDTGGFMLQLVESGQWQGRSMDAKLGMGQRIEIDMANTMNLKVFQVYIPVSSSSIDYELNFEDRHIDFITSQISDWYGNQCKDMSVTIIKQSWWNYS